MTIHRQMRVGSPVLVILKDGTQIYDRFVESNDKRMLLKRHGWITFSKVRSSARIRNDVYRQNVDPKEEPALPAPPTDPAEAAVVAVYAQEHKRLAAKVAEQDAWIAELEAENEELMSQEQAAGFDAEAFCAELEAAGLPGVGTILVRRIEAWLKERADA